MSRRRKIALGAAAVASLGLAVGYFRFYQPLRGAVDIGAAMLAKQVCSCVYLAGRETADCRADQFEAMDRIQLEVLRDELRVRAWVPMLGERSAIYREGFGCALE